MRYSDEEIFELHPKLLNELKSQLRFNDFCEWAIKRMQYLIEESTKERDWMNNSTNHLRNYRLKAIKFYEQKMGQ